MDVSGCPFMHNEFRLCVRRTSAFEGPWCVDEYDTGLSVVRNYSSKKDAVFAAKKLLDNKGGKATAKAIESGLETLRKVGLI